MLNASVVFTIFILDVKTLKSSRDGFNVFNVSSINMAIHMILF